MTTARGSSRAGADKRNQPRGVLTRSRGGRGVGGYVVRGGYRATEAQRCQCCRCRIKVGGLVYEVLVDDELLEVCVDCAGES
jgi:hypothetical protein